MASCAVDGGCPTDYIAISICFYQGSYGPFWFTKFFVLKTGIWYPVIQVFASLNFLLSIVMAADFLKFQKEELVESCYIWAVWVEGPLGFGLLLSSRIAQSFHLYYILVSCFRYSRRRLPPIRSYIFLPLILLPWPVGAAFSHMKRPLNHRCHMGVDWMIPVLCLHAIYVATLVGFLGGNSAYRV